jgi:hypothetical protein
MAATLLVGIERALAGITADAPFSCSSGHGAERSDCLRDSTRDKGLEIRDAHAGVRWNSHAHDATPADLSLSSAALNDGRYHSAVVSIVRGFDQVSRRMALLISHVVVLFRFVHEILRLRSILHVCPAPSFRVDRRWPEYRCTGVLRVRFRGRHRRCFRCRPCACSVVPALRTASADSNRFQAR